MTLSTSVIKPLIRKNALGYLGATLFCLIFALIYAQFSHSVHSYYMEFAFAIPLVTGLLTCLGLWGLRESTTRDGWVFRQLMAGGCVWLTLGSIFRGVLEIYGTTNRLVAVFAVIGATQIAIGMGLQFLNREFGGHAA